MRHVFVCVCVCVFGSVQALSAAVDHALLLCCALAGDVVRQAPQPAVPTVLFIRRRRKEPAEFDLKWSHSLSIGIQVCL